MSFGKTETAGIGQKKGGQVITHPPIIISYRGHRCPPLFNSNEKGCALSRYTVAGLLKAPVGMFKSDVA